MLTPSPKNLPGQVFPWMLKGHNDVITITVINLHFLTYKPNFVGNFIANDINDQRGEKIWGICVQFCENVKMQEEDIYFRAQAIHFSLQFGTHYYV